MRKILKRETSDGRNEGESSTPSKEKDSKTENLGWYGEHEPQIKIEVLAEDKDNLGMCIVKHSCLGDVQFFLKLAHLRGMFEDCQSFKAVFFVEDGPQMVIKQAIASSFKGLVDLLTSTDPATVHYYLPDLKIIVLVCPDGMICLDYEKNCEYENNTLALDFAGYYTGSLTNFEEMETLFAFFKYEIDNYNKIPVANRRFNKPV